MNNQHLNNPRPLPQKPIVAAFDFDGTLTDRDSLPSFLCYTHGFVRTYFNFFCQLPLFAAYIASLRSRQQTKEAVLTQFFKEEQLQSLQEKGQEFAAKKLNHLVKPEGLERLQWHLEQGHRCILISANLDLYLEPWAKKHGFHKAICSIVDSSSGKVTGKLKGLNCWGPEKVRRLEELLGPKTNYTLYAYGDSRGDQELLELADHAFYRRF